MKNDTSYSHDKKIYLQLAQALGIYCPPNFHNNQLHNFHRNYQIRFYPDCYHSIYYTLDQVLKNALEDEAMLNLKTAQLVSERLQARGFRTEAMRTIYAASRNPGTEKTPTRDLFCGFFSAILVERLKALTGVVGSPIGMGLFERQLCQTSPEILLYLIIQDILKQAQA